MTCTNQTSPPPKTCIKKHQALDTCITLACKGEFYQGKNLQRRREARGKNRNRAQEDLYLQIGCRDACVFGDGFHLATLCPFQSHSSDGTGQRPFGHSCQFYFRLYFGWVLKLKCFGQFRISAKYFGVIFQNIYIKN